MLVRSAPKYATDFMEMLDWDVSKVHAKASKKDFLENQACSLEGYIDFMPRRHRRAFLVSERYARKVLRVALEREESPDSTDKNAAMMYHAWSGRRWGVWKGVCVVCLCVWYVFPDARVV